MIRLPTDPESRPTEAVDLSANLINTTSDPTDLDSAVEQNSSSIATDNKDTSVSVDCPTKQDSSDDPATSEESSEPSHKPVDSLSDTSNKQSKELDSSTPGPDCLIKQEDLETSNSK